MISLGKLPQSEYGEGTRNTRYNFDQAEIEGLILDLILLVS